MIPPFLATMAGKVGMGLLGAAVVAGAIYAYNARQQSIGYNDAKEEMHEQVQKQAETVKQYEDVQGQDTIASLERMIAEKDKFNAAMLRENKRLKDKLKEPEVIHDVRYIEVPKDVEKPVYSQLFEPCLVPEALVARVDDLASVLNQIPYHRVPISGEAAGEPAVQGSPSVSCTALIARIEALTSALGNSLIEHRSLSEKAVLQYQRYEAWRKGQANEVARETRPND